jgi:hypothetical protein
MLTITRKENQVAPGKESSSAATTIRIESRIQLGRLETKPMIRICCPPSPRSGKRYIGEVPILPFAPEAFAFDPVENMSINKLEQLPENYVTMCHGLILLLY